MIDNKINCKKKKRTPLKYENSCGCTLKLGSITTIELIKLVNEKTFRIFIEKTKNYLKYNIC